MTKTDKPAAKLKPTDPEFVVIRLGDAGVKWAKATVQATEVGYCLKALLPQARVDVTDAREAIPSAVAETRRVDVLAVIEQHAKSNTADIEFGEDLGAIAEAKLAEAERIHNGIKAALVQTDRAILDALQAEEDLLAKNYARLVYVPEDPDLTVREAATLKAQADELAPLFEVAQALATRHINSSPEERKRLKAKWAARRPVMPTLAEVKKELADGEYNSPKNVKARADAAARKAERERDIRDAASAARFRNKQHQVDNTVGTK